MKLVHTINELRAELDIQRQAGKKIGLVPTMGLIYLQDEFPSDARPVLTLLLK